MGKEADKNKSIPLTLLVPFMLLVLVAGLVAVNQLTLMKGALTIAAGEIIAPSDFVNHGKDIVEFAEGGEDFDNYAPGTYTVHIKYGFITRTATLIVEDKIPPTITSSGDFAVTIGESVIYRDKVRVSDNCDEYPALFVDTNLVRPNEPGKYPVVYTAVDVAGNSATEILWVTFKEYVPPDEAEILAAEVNERADEILASITSEEMTDRDRAWAIYQYVTSHLSYISFSEKGDIMRAAYEGLFNGRGDCYVFFATSKVLLDRANVINKPIERLTDDEGKVRHYWNLVDIMDGHGWYHFDTTPTSDRKQVFLWDNEQIRAYSEERGDGYYTYDEEEYADIL